jgi:Holliday junction resolvase RusA-like endonuclease
MAAVSLYTTTIYGTPIGEGRPRAVRIGAGVRVHAAPKSAEWRALAASQMRSEWSQDAIDYPVRVLLVAMMPRPKSRPSNVSAAAWKSGAPVARGQKPDVDNIAKAALDALVEAGVLVDDTLVCELTVTRRMSSEQGSPRGSLLIIEDDHRASGSQDSSEPS